MAILSKAMKHKLEYPAKRLTSGCLYSSVAHAVANLKFPFFSYDQSWNGENYSFQFDRSRGTVTFDKENDLIVAAFRDDTSSRLLDYPEYKAAWLFSEADERVRKIAESETLEYLYYAFGKVSMPAATTAMWSEGDAMYSPDDDAAFIVNGGEFIGIICAPPEELAEHWIEQYEFTEDELAAVDYLYKSKCDGVARLALKDIPLAIDKGSDGYAEFLTSLSELSMEIE